MLALRRLRPLSLGFARQGATVHVALASTTVDADSSQSQSSQVSAPKSRSRPIRTRRPRISLQHPREWNRPLAFGVLPAFDEALKVIKEDSIALKQEAVTLQEAIARAKEVPQSDTNALQALEEKLRILEVQSEINFPEVRWKCANGMGKQVGDLTSRYVHTTPADMSKAVDRHLVEQRWRKEGALDLLVSIHLSSSALILKFLLCRWNVSIR
jgi:large subunit ribosomal protein L35